MGATPICTVDATGIHRPALADCIAYFEASYRAIYGSDTVLDADTQDGQFMGLLGAALDDYNAEGVSVYNAFSPATAQGAGLASNVKINGLTRNIPSNSTVPVLVVGVASLSVPPTAASDGLGNQWSVPATTIPLSGQITVTATCQTLGAIQLGTGVALTILNPTRGLQSVTTTAVATPGAPVELDAALRARQAQSTAAPSSTMLGSVVGAVWGVPGIVRLRAYENETNAPDGNGIPGNSIALVIEGGDATAIANAIASRKFACGTYGTTTETYLDSIGISHAINFFYATQPPITWGVTIHPGPTFSTNTIALIQQSLAAWTNAAGIGNGLQLTRAYSAAYLAPSIAATSQALQAAVLAGDTGSIQTLTAQLASLNAAAQTYEVTALTIARDGNALAAADISIAFNEDAYLAVNSDGTLVNPANVTVTLA